MVKTKITKRVACLILLITILISSISMTSLQAFGADDYPYRGGTIDAVDQWNFYTRECTSFCAWRLNNNNGVAFTNWYGGVRWGNAGNWGYAAQSLGIAVNSTPGVGSIAWWSGGHVAWVSAVNGSTVTIEEYNYNYSYSYFTRNIASSSVSGFIHIKDINPHTHSYSSSVTTQPTCTQTGVRTYTCSCGASYTETIAKKAHTSQSVEAVAATCTTKGRTAGTKCSVCGTTLSGLTETPARGHRYQYIDEVAPTCTTTGISGGIKCSVCGETISGLTEIAALGHDYQLEERIEPTCTKAGKQTDICTVCGDVKETTISSLGHSLRDDGVYSVKNDLTFYTQTCSRCEEPVSYVTNEFRNEKSQMLLLGNIGVAGMLRNAIVDKSVLSKVAVEFNATSSHPGFVYLSNCNYSAEMPINVINSYQSSDLWRGVLEADVSQLEVGDYRVQMDIASILYLRLSNQTYYDYNVAHAISTITVMCSHSDVTEYDCVDGKCPYCGEELEIEHIHLYTSKVTKKATCTESGTITYTCPCGDSYTETIPATGHTPGDWEVETEATPNYDGLEVIRCTVCTEILEERAIPKLSGPIPGTLYLDKKPSKISYELNEAFDPTGAILRVKYNDGTIKSLSLSDVQIVGFDTTTGGNKKVHFSYTENGVTLNTWEFTILVDRQVTAIYIPHKPNKTHYICGEAFERDGMQIIATYSDGTKADVTAEIRTSGFDSTTFGLKKMTVSYTYKGKTVTLQFSYEMNPKLTGLVLTHKPNKLGTYKVGEPLSKEGMIITAKFSDGSTKDVTHLIRTSGYSSKQVGKQIITVSYTYGTQTKKVQFSIIMSE